CTKLLHSFRDPGLGHCLGSAATYHDAIIAIIENQRSPSYCAAYLIVEARRRTARSREHKFAVFRGIGEFLASALAAGLLELHCAAGDDLGDLAALQVWCLAGGWRRGPMNAWCRGRSE